MVSALTQVTEDELFEALLGNLTLGLSSFCFLHSVPFSLFFNLIIVGHTAFGKKGNLVNHSSTLHCLITETCQGDQINDTGNTETQSPKLEFHRTEQPSCVDLTPYGCNTRGRSRKDFAIFLLFIISTFQTGLETVVCTKVIFTHRQRFHLSTMVCTSEMIPDSKLLGA